MAGLRKRSPDQRRQDMAVLAELYLKGWTQVEIGRHLGISQRQVSHDLQKVRSMWHERAVDAIAVYSERELAKIDHLERTYWDAWDRSTKQRTIRSTERKTAGKGGQGEDKASIRTEDMVGNPAFLAGVLACMERRAKHLGIDAPQKIAPTTPDGTNPYQAMTTDQIKKRIAVLHAELVSAGALPADGGPGRQTEGQAPDQ